mmetsp:Transcript_4761/g.10733  ORF Transcript_4761/g.10733 Transcript_4761/m.10733 type:complete len:419 (+) Transcript_4761:178-1434(+)
MIRRQSCHSVATIRLFCVGLLLCLPRVESIMPTAAVDVHLDGNAAGTPSYTLFASQASFGSHPSMHPDRNEPRSLRLPPKGNALLCQNVTSPEKEYEGTVLVIPRGQCTFETKAMNAQRLGAASVLIYGTLASRYSLNKTASSEKSPTEHEIIYPLNLVDYDCSKGRAEISSSALEMQPFPYNAKHNDPLLSGDTKSNLCIANSPESLQSCPSKACLLTGNSTTDGMVEACCAWDLHVWLYADPAFKKGDVNIPAFYITMQEADRLMKDLQSNELVVVFYMRYRATYNLSSLLIWALGVIVAALAAYLSASDYRSAANELCSTNTHDDNNTSRDELLEHGPRSNDTAETTPLARTNNLTPYAPAEESLELSDVHAIGFVIMASSGLFILFFFKVRHFIPCCCQCHLPDPDVILCRFTV